MIRRCGSACSQALASNTAIGDQPALVPTLIKGLGRPTGTRVVHLIGVLARMSPDPRATVPPLITVLREPAESDRAVATGLPPTSNYMGPAQEAANALGRIAPGTPSAGDAIAALTETVHRDREAAGRGGRCPGKFGTAAAAAVPGLVAFLRESIAGKVATVDGPSAAKALGQLAPGTSSASAAVAALMAALKAESPVDPRGRPRGAPSFKPASPESIAAIRAVQEKDPAMSRRPQGSGRRRSEAIQGEEKTVAGVQGGSTRGQGHGRWRRRPVTIVAVSCVAGLGFLLAGCGGPRPHATSASPRDRGRDRSAPGRTRIRDRRSAAGFPGGVEARATGRGPSGSWMSSPARAWTSFMSRA